MVQITPVCVCLWVVVGGGGVCPAQSHGHCVQDIVRTACWYSCGL